MRAVITVSQLVSRFRALLWPCSLLLPPFFVSLILLFLFTLLTIVVALSDGGFPSLLGTFIRRCFVLVPSFISLSACARILTFARAHKY